MHYVIIRDDDTNALTPVECLERLYRPFLDRGLPVNLAVIPAVATDTRTPDGKLEGFLRVRKPEAVLAGVAGGASQHQKSLSAIKEDTPALNLPGLGEFVPIAENFELTRYLLENPLYHILQHGCHHDWLEFDRTNLSEIVALLEKGTRHLLDAGFSIPETFVAPYDKLSRTSFVEVGKRFSVISTGWYELRRLPHAWWPNYFVKKAFQKCHWQANGTKLLSHPGCMLSCFHSPQTIFPRIKAHVESHRITVLVTHWWEYFRNGEPDQAFIRVLHETAEYLATRKDLKVVSFEKVARGEVPTN